MMSRTKTTSVDDDWQDLELFLEIYTYHFKIKQEKETTLKFYITMTMAKPIFESETCVKIKP